MKFGITNSQEDMQRLHLAEELLRFDAQDPPVAPLDDLTRKRDIDKILERAVSDESIINNYSSPIGDHFPRRIIMSAVGFLSVLVIIAIWGTTAWIERPTGSTTESTKNLVVEQIPQPALLSAAVLIATGEARGLIERTANAANLPEGSWIEVSRGMAAVGLAERAKVRLGEHTRMQLRKLDSQNIELYLQRGELFVSLKPGTEKQRFRVITERGSVLVTGTVFRVRVEDDQAAVEVFRGSVRVRHGDTEKHTLVAMQQMQLSLGATVQPLTRDVVDNALETAQMVDQLEYANSAQLEVVSDPSGATVILDHVEMGHTPLVLNTKPGYRRLELKMNGYAPVVEQAGIAPDQIVSRFFELSPVSENKPTQHRTTPAKVAITASKLLERAQQLRKQRNWHGAAKIYAQIIKIYPASAQARNTSVALGQIQLKHLDRPTEALKNFTTYFNAHRNGALAQEAAYGRAESLRRLGSINNERRSLREFLAYFPGSLWADDARRRLQDLNQQPLSTQK